jgi:serine/threonine protein kinase
MTQEEFHKRYQYNPNTDCLGEGGFGKVYKAYDTYRDRYVAIKMAEVKPHLEEVRLKKEVEIISKLPSHQNIAHYEDCYTFSTFAGEYDFGVLQYYEEGNLQQLLIDKQLNYEQKDSLLRQILEGIIFLHSQGIIHRDLKPQNILISNRDGKYIPKITDFGISKKLDVNKSTFFTNSLAGAGTLSFSSPEQLLGNTIRKNTDLWSFGVIACWMFTGKLPFNTGNQTVTSEAGRIELFRQITSGDITALIRQLPSVWQKLVKQCIVVDSDKRISGAVKCLELLEGKVEVDVTESSNGNTTVNNTIPTQTPDKKDVVYPTSFPNTSTSYPQHTPNSKGNPTPWIIAGIGVLIVSLIIFFTTNRSPVESGSDRTIVSTADTVAIPSPIISQNIDYSSYQNARYNYSIEYPQDILYEQREASNSDGTFFKTKEGVEKLRVYGISNIDIETANELSLDQLYDQELLNYSQNTSTITYKKLGTSFFVISGYDNGSVFYLKVIRCKDYGGYNAFAYALLKYSESERDLYDKISEHIFKSFTGNN